MQDDRVSTPDILGVLQGEDGIRQGLVRLDPSASDVETHKRALVRLFEDRTADFVRNLSPLVAAGDGDKAEHERLDTLLGTSHPLLPDDEGLETLVSELIGTACFKAAGREHVYRIEVPARFRGPGVLAAYPCATFRRSVAVREKAAEVDFITPLHPFMQAMAAVSRLRLLQVYPDQPGLPPRRLAARRVPASEPVSAVFTFLGQAAGGGGLREETMIAVRVAPDCRVIGTPEEALRWLNADGAAGEVPTGTLERLFQSSFKAMAGAAIEAAGARLLGRIAELREHRRAQAEVLRHDLEIDLADRLSEIEDEERRAKGLEEESGQLRLISLEEARPAGFEARRAAAKAQAEKRRDEIAAFERVEGPVGPRPLGALFLVPEGQS